MNNTDNTAADAGRNEYSNVYEISEFLTDEQYDEYMSDDGTLFHRLLDYRTRLDDCSEFEFYAYANNLIEVINSDIPEICHVNYGTEFEAGSEYIIDGENITATEAIQVSENFFTLFPVKITEGRSFQPSDFDSRDSEPIPVILGNAYQESFRLGDTFEAYYILERRTFTVIGFTDTESVFWLRAENRMASYERFIVMPFLNIEGDSASMRAILLQQICGFIKTYDDRSIALLKLQGCLKGAGLEDWIEAIMVNSRSLQEK